MYLNYTSKHAITKQPGKHLSAQGFTLLELLVSMIIMAIGLLGLAALQTIALKDNQDAFFYTQAASLAYEMSDRIKVNPGDAATTGTWRNATLPSASTCTNTCTLASPCTTAQMANFDYCSWKNIVQNRIAPDATATVTASGTTGVCNGGTSKRCLTISWTRNHQASTNSTNTFKIEITP